MFRGRKTRRERGRAHEKLVREAERLASLEPGGKPDRPIEVDSPAIVDMRAVANPCPLCGGSLKLDDHAAVEIEGVRLRAATVSCTRCRVGRTRYFRLGGLTVH